MSYMEYKTTENDIQQDSLDIHFSYNFCLSFLYMCSAFDYDTENMNSEDIYSSLKGVTEAIQNFSVRSQEDMNEPVQRREGEEVCRADWGMLYVLMCACICTALCIKADMKLLKLY